MGGFHLKLKGTEPGHDRCGRRTSEQGFERGRAHPAQPRNLLGGVGIRAVALWLQSHQLKVLPDSLSAFFGAISSHAQVAQRRALALYARGRWFESAPGPHPLRVVECVAPLWRARGVLVAACLLRSRPAARAVLSAEALQPGSPPISSSSSAVFSRIRAASPRLSTLSRIRGSVFDVRRLKRHASNSRLTPSVRSSLRAAGR